MPMIVKINGRVVNYNTAVTKPIKNDTFSWKSVTKEPENVTIPQKPETAQPKTETLRDRLARIREAAKRHILPLTTGINLLAMAPISTLAGQYSVATQAVPVAAKTYMGIAPALQPVISMLQELALPVGIGMAIWGLIEIIIGNPGGKDKIKYALLGYIGVFVIPYFFYQIKGALSVMPLAMGLLGVA